MYQDFLEIDRPIQDVVSFQRHNAKVLELRALHDNDLSWITMPAPTGESENAASDPIEGWVSAPVFSKPEGEYIFERIWKQAAELNGDLRDKKLSNATEFVDFLDLELCQQDESRVSFVPDATLSGCETVEAVLTWARSGDLPAKAASLKAFGSGKVKATSDHPTFAFASFDPEARREDAFTIMLQLSELQHLGAKLLAQMVDLNTEGVSDKLPSQQWIDDAKDFKAKVNFLDALYTESIEAIVTANTEIASGDATAIALRDLMRKWLKPAPGHLKLAKLLAESFKGFLESSMISKLSAHHMKVQGMVPDGYQALCHFKGPTRSVDSIQALIRDYSPKIANLNSAKCAMLEAMNTVTSLRADGLGIDASIALEACRRNYSKANLFIATLGLANLMFIKSNTKLKTLDAAIASVKQLNVWPYETEIEESARIAGLQGLNDGIPTVFRKEILEFREELLKKESLQSA